MKAEHRHELKTNELADWLSNLPQWATENSKVIIGLSVLIIVLAGLYGWIYYNKNIVQVRRQQEYTALLTAVAEAKSRAVQAQSLGIDGSYLIAQVADELKNFAQKTSNKNMAALALLKQGEALRAELQYRTQTPDKELLTRRLDEAKDAYNLALQKSTDKTLTAAAKFGLGLCEEDIGNFDQARKIYEEIVANPDFSHTTTASQAHVRLITMSENQQDVVFLPTPVKPLAPAKTDANLADANLPGVVWSDANLPDVVWSDVNLPAGANVPIKISVLPPVEVNTPEQE